MHLYVDHLIWKLVRLGATHFLERNLTTPNLTSSYELVVIQPRFRISLPYKVVQAIWLASQIVLVIIIPRLLFAISIPLC